MTRDHAPAETVQMRPGPLQLTLENRSNVRTLPGIWVVSDKVHNFVGKRRPFLTAKRLLTNQTFRDIHRTDALDVDQRLKITSLTFLFTDLKGSTELYERVGDLVAYDLVRAHFRILNQIIAAERGAVVKTIGDAVMATFPTPDRAMAAALKMREALKDLKGRFAAEDRHPRRTMSRRFAERSTGLLRADGEYRSSRPGTRDVALHFRNQTSRYRQRSLEVVAIERHLCDAGEALTSRYRQSGRDFRNTVRRSRDRLPILRELCALDEHRLIFSRWLSEYGEA